MSDPNPYGDHSPAGEALLDHPGFDITNDQKKRVVEFDWDQPDLSTLPQRMRYAADVLEEASARHVIRNDAPWVPGQLRFSADKWEAEDRAAADRDTQVEELARDAYDNWCNGHDTWPPKLNEQVEFWRDCARKLIESGWHK